MKRISVTNIFGVSFVEDYEDPTDRIAFCEANHIWGLPQRWVDADQCSDADKAAATATQEILQMDGTLKVQYLLPAQYTLTITDVSGEYQQKANDAYALQRSAECETAVQALLGPMQDVTHLMMSMYDLTLALNVLGVASEDDMNAAKARIGDALNLMSQINDLRAQRDADIAAYIAAHPVN